MKRLLFTLTMMLMAFMANAQSCPDNNHPHAIDLGLPSGTKWACCNVGATTPEGYGIYYAWGETEEKEIYDWTTYIHCDGSETTCHDLGLDIAGSEYDVAHVRWGGSWVMPSQDQLQEMVSRCQYTCTQKKGVGGHLFTGPSGGTVFLPEADFWRESHPDNAALDCNNDSVNKDTDKFPSTGYYWSSTQSPTNSHFANCLLFSNGFAYWDSHNYRCAGLTVRPVISGKTNGIRPISQMKMQNSNTLFDLQGRRLTRQPAKGVYIQDGKKRVR